VPFTTNWSNSSGDGHLDGQLPGWALRVIAVDGQGSRIGHSGVHGALIGNICIDDARACEHGVFSDGQSVCGGQRSVLRESAPINGGIVDEKVAVGDESASPSLEKSPGTTIVSPDIVAVPSGTSSSPLVTLSPLTTWSEELSSKVSESASSDAAGDQTNPHGARIGTESGDASAVQGKGGRVIRPNAKTTEAGGGDGNVACGEGGAGSKTREPMATAGAH
jgi:hypothetical protein